MQQYKINFINFLLESNALKFGQFTLKSGRISPYFINAGQFNTGEALARLGSYYADMINDNIKDFNVIFGPAYKGIPLAVTTAAALYKEHGRNVGYSFNRKEAKDHGEGGMIVGAPLSSESKVVIIDDVITAGTAMRDTLEVFKKNGNPQIVGIAILVDRMEKGLGETSAIQDLEKETGVKVYPIVTVLDIMEYLHDEHYEAMQAYRKQYGV
ncbi:MAG: orotate phosphoribosyltransferase [Patescibacteria group bacterium]